MRHALISSLSAISLGVLVSLPALGAPDEELDSDVSEIVGLVQDNAAALLPFGKKAPPPRGQLDPATTETAPRAFGSRPGESEHNGSVPGRADSATDLVGAASTDVLWEKAAAPLGVMALLVFGAILLLRKNAPSRHVQVLEVTPLGRGRSVAVVQVAGRPVLLGVSEGGVNLLIDELPIVAAPITDATTPSFFDRLFRRAARPGGFEPQVFQMTDEDDELRRKIAAHLNTGSPAAPGVH